MRVFKTKAFARFARKARLENARLLEAARSVASGQWDVDLGGRVFKQRIARDGDGKSGSFRAILRFRIGEHSFFVHGFAKRDKANITTKELVALKKLADEFFAFSAETLARVCAAGEITEITDSHGKGEQDA